MSAFNHQARLRLWYARQRPTITRSFLLASGLTLLLLWKINPATILHRAYQPGGYQPDGAYVGAMAANAFRGAAPSVLVVGGSSMRDMMLPDDQASTWLSTRCGSLVSVFNAATSSQNPSESWTIVDALDRPPRVVVVGLTYRRMTRSRLVDPYNLGDQRTELPQSPTAVLQSLAHADLRGGQSDFFGQIKRMRWSIATLIGDLRGRPRDMVDRRGILSETPLSPDRKRYIVDKLYVVSDGELARTGDQMVAYWTTFAREMRRRGSTTLFLVNPLSPETAYLQRAEAAPMAVALSALARDYPVLDLRTGSGLETSDFIDPLHVSGPGRERAWPRLGEAIIRALGCAPAGAAAS